MLGLYLDSNVSVLFLEAIFSCFKYFRFAYITVIE